MRNGRASVPIGRRQRLGYRYNTGTWTRCTETADRDISDTASKLQSGREFDNSVYLRKGVMVGTEGSSRCEQLVKGAGDEVMGKEVQDESTQHILPP